MLKILLAFCRKRSLLNSSVQAALTLLLHSTSSSQREDPCISPKMLQIKYTTQAISERLSERSSCPQSTILSFFLLGCPHQQHIVRIVSNSPFSTCLRSREPEEDSQHLTWHRSLCLLCSQGPQAQLHLWPCHKPGGHRMKESGPKFWVKVSHILPNSTRIPEMDESRENRYNHKKSRTDQREKIGVKT